MYHKLITPASQFIGKPDDGNNEKETSHDWLAAKKVEAVMLSFG